MYSLFARPVIVVGRVNSLLTKNLSNLFREICYNPSPVSTFVPSFDLKLYDLIIFFFFCSSIAFIQNPQYRIRVAMANEYEHIVDFMRETFLKTEPSIINIGLSGKNAPLLLHQVCLGLRQGISLVAVHKSGKLAGVAINTDTSREELKPLCYYSTRHPGPEADILDFYLKVYHETDLWRAYGVKNIFECANVAVHPDHSGQGLGRALVLESWLLARDLAYRLLRIDCSSVYTAKIAEKLGWKLAYKIPFADYKADGCNPVFRHVCEPHTELKVYVDRVNYFKGYLPPLALKK